MNEPWFSRWYVPLGFGAIGISALLVMVVAVAEVLTVETPGDAPFSESTAHLNTADEELARGHVAAAEVHLRAAYTAALRVPGWESLVEVGDGFRRTADKSEARAESSVQARAAYLAALVRARHGRSVDGVLRAAEGFAALGDDDVVRQCIVIARRLAERRGDSLARGRVRAFTERWSTRAHTSGEEIVQ